MTHTLERAGDRLANGFVLVAASGAHPGGAGTVPTRIVLAADGSGKYATWMQRLDDGATSNGDYFKPGRFVAAVDAYVARCAAHGVAA